MWCIHSSVCVSCIILRYLYYYSFIVVICSGGDGERPVKENDGVSSCCSLSPTNLSSFFLSIVNSEKHKGTGKTSRCHGERIR